jgi:hypothetical protein
MLCELLAAGEVKTAAVSLLLVAKHSAQGVPL